MACLAAGLLLVLGCRDMLPTATRRPAGPPSPAAVRVDAGPLAGCTRVHVELRGRDSVVVTELDGLCGPVRLRLARPAVFDRVHQVVRLSMAIENAGERKIRAPALVYAWPDSLLVTSPPGLDQNRHTSAYLAFVGSDSTRSAADPELPNAAIWRYDTLLATPASEAQTVAAGGRSQARPIEISVKQGVAEFTAVFGASASRASAPVPLQAPDSIPAWVYAPENRATFDSLGTVVNKIIIVTFVSGATQAQRQDAIDLVDGEVVGGQSDPLGGEGDYFVRVQDRGTGMDMLQKQRALSSLPQVATATIDHVKGFPYLKPNDGPHWDQWLVEWGAMGPHENWGLEAIQAPLAWGCDTGAVSTQVAVVDHGFFAIGDLDPHLPADHLLPVGDPSTFDHGTQVSAVLAAVGDNGQGITGTMWRSDLRLYDVGYDNTGHSTSGLTGPPTTTNYWIVYRIRKAIGAGATIVNASVGIEWTDPKEKLTASGKASAKASSEDFAKELSRIPAAKMPLIVLPAGNDSLDAFYSGNQGALTAYPNNVVIVAASDRLMRLPAFTNDNRENHYVEIAAPGDNVGTLNRSGAKVAGSGTSLAAPYVAGVAGLIKAHDPRLTPPDLKLLLVAGAILGGHSAGGIPVLNAWESLKLVAARRGAPLCANRIWQKDGRIWVRRGAADTESLFSLPETAWYINALHGGRRLRLFKPSIWDYRDFVFDNGSWTEQPRTYTGLPGGTIRSTGGVSHSADSAVIAGGQMGRFPITIRDVRAGTYETIATVHGPWTVGSSICTRQLGQGEWVVVDDTIWKVRISGYVCVDSIASMYHRSYATAAFSPLGDYVLVAVNSEVETYGLLRDYYTCDYTTYDEFGNPWNRCRDFTHGRGSAGTTVYSIALGSFDRTPKRMWSEQNRTTPWAGIAEGGAEAVSDVSFSYMSETRKSVFRGYTWHLDPFDATSGHRDCAFTFRKMTTGALLEEVPSNDACAEELSTATISNHPQQPVVNRRP